MKLLISKLSRRLFILVRFRIVRVETFIYEVRYIIIKFLTNIPKKCDKKLLELKEWSEESAKLKRTQISKDEPLELNDHEQKKVGKEDYKSHEVYEKTSFNQKYYEERVRYLIVRDFKIANLNLLYPQ